jgi:hypothetical protein
MSDQIKPQIVADPTIRRFLVLFGLASQFSQESAICQTQGSEDSDIKVWSVTELVLLNISENHSVTQLDMTGSVNHHVKPLMNQDRAIGGTTRNGGDHEAQTRVRLIRTRHSHWPDRFH